MLFRHSYLQRVFEDLAFLDYSAEHSMKGILPLESDYSQKLEERLNVDPLVAFVRMVHLLRGNSFFLIPNYLISKIHKSP